MHTLSEFFSKFSIVIMKLHFLKKMQLSPVTTLQLITFFPNVFQNLKICHESIHLEAKAVESFSMVKGGKIMKGKMLYNPEMKIAG